jgi:uncharacterized protein YvpB/Na+-transporting methylmalonyl-CoA/oxaloacetate decarboxylase gamma subunit
MKKFLDNNFEALIILIGVFFVLLVLNNLIVIITYIIRPIKRYFAKRAEEKMQVSVLTRSEPEKKESRLGRLLPESLGNIKLPKLFSLPKIKIWKGDIRNTRVWKILFHTYMYYLVNILLICLIWIVFYGIQYRQPKVIGSSPEHEGQLSNPEQAISVEFSRPINTTVLEMNLGPDIRGTWERSKLFGIFPLTTEMMFHPEETALPDDDMILYVVGFNPEDIGEHLIEFKSAPIPVLQNSNIQNGQEMVPVDSGIEFEFDREIDDSVEYKIEIEPSFEYRVETRGTKIIVIPETRLDLNTDYDVKLFQSKIAYEIDTKEVIQRTEPENIYNLSFKTDEIALIESVSPSGTNVMTDAQAVVKFGKLVEKENVEERIRFEPEVPFTSTWNSDSEIVITPSEPLEKASKYQIVLGEGIVYDQTQTMFDYKFEFETIGYVKVSSFSPENEAVGRAINTQVWVNFDQEVDHGSAESAFEISPSVAGTFHWDTNSMIFTPSNLSYQTKYTVKINSGVKTVHGLDSNEEYSSSFTTQGETTTISVPYYRQVQRFECEVLSFRMIMAHRGVYLSNSQVLSGVGVSSVPYNSANNTWGDPNADFVGDITGASKGYGVHLGPLASLAQAYGRSTRVGSNWTVAEVTNEVSKGNPVMILAQNGYSTPTNISWRTPEGKYVHAINGTHAYIVVGYKGSASNPTSLLLQDPWYRGGSRRWFSMSYFNTLWSYHSNSALVVY